MLPSNIRKIAVFRALQLGDLLCAVPALRALRQAYPDAEIVLLGLPWSTAFVNRFSVYVDSMIHFPGYKGLPEQPYDEAAFQSFVSHMCRERFDLLLQMQGNGTIVNDFILHLGARHVAGYHNSQSLIGSPLFMHYPEGIHEVQRHLQLMQHISINGTPEMEFPVTATDKKELEDLLLPLVPQRYVCIHPGSRAAWRQWPPSHFALLADYCIEQGYTAVITGTADEALITQEVIKCMKHPAIDLTGKTSLGCMAAVLADAYLLISNCTGVAHIAAATQTRSIVISMDGEPERWGPMNQHLHTAIDCSQALRLPDVLEATVAKINAAMQLHAA
jgi:ADP-heptose:LPS heptosyltransferase